MGTVQDYVRQWVAGILQPVVDARAAELADRRAHYEGKQYDNKGMRPSWTKVPPGVNPGPLRTQKPAVQYDLPKLLVDRPTALLAGEGRFPTLGFKPAAGDTDVTDVEEWLNAAAEEGELAHAGLLAARWAGAEGSAAIVWEIVAGELRFTPLLGEHCTPTFDPKDPRRVVSLERRYPVTQREGTKDVLYWYRETWDATAHAIYPLAKAKPDGTPPDAWPAPSSVPHGLGFCPAVWVRIVDDPCGGDAPDGIALHAGTSDVTEDIDRVLGQKARAVLQNQDPRTAYYGASEATLSQLKHGGSDFTMPSQQQGAAVQLIEMSGEGQRVAEEHIQAQRDRALETSRVVSPSPDRLLAAARSGAALRVLHGAMLELVGELRVPFGRALRQLAQQLVAAVQSGALAALGSLATPPPATIPPGRVTLLWGDYFDATPEDLLLAAQTAESLQRAGLDDETIVTWLARRFGWRNAHDILERVQGARGDRASLLEQATTSVAAQKDAEPDGDEVAPAPGAPPAQDANIQDTALNGAQVTSLLEVVQLAASKTLPKGSAAAILRAAFPALDPSLVSAILDPLDTHEPPPKPEPAVPPVPAAPIAPPEEKATEPKNG